MDFWALQPSSEFQKLHQGSEMAGIAVVLSEELLPADPLMDPGTFYLYLPALVILAKLAASIQSVFSLRCMFLYLLGLNSLNLITISITKGPFETNIVSNPDFYAIRCMF